MKHVLCMIFLFLLLLCCCACGKKEASSAKSTTAAAVTLNADALLQAADVEHHDCAKLGHVFSIATCQSPAECYYCGETNGEKGAHDFTHATCLQKKTCTVCGLETGDFAAHLFTNATCAAPASCAVCGQTTGSASAHNFRAATCVSPSRCSVCMQTRGSALGHQWTGGSCTEPKVCTRCKRHLAAPGHKMTGGSCTQNAVCSVCGYTVKAAGHQFENGVCTVCGQSTAEASRVEASRVEASMAAAASERLTETTEPPIDRQALQAFGERIGQLLQTAHDTADDAIGMPPETRVEALQEAVDTLKEAQAVIGEARDFCKTDGRLTALVKPLDEVERAIRTSAATTVRETGFVDAAIRVRADATSGLDALQTFRKAAEKV